MGTIRFFSGGRDSSKRSFASELVRLEIQKKGKLEPGERYKLLMKKKFSENKMKLNIAGTRKMTKRAENAIKEMAAKKAAKEAKALRRMVIVQPKNYSNGRLDKKGKVYDIAGNLVANVNTKNGRIATTGGWALGKYKAKSYMTQLVLQDAINKYSPHYINLRKMQAMQQGYNPAMESMQHDHDIGNHGSSSMTRAQDVINMYGSSMQPASEQADPAAFYGSAPTGPRQNVGVTAWGAMSDNAWGTFADNAWGTSADTVWGTNMSDVWGGIGGSPYGGKSVRMWGTGNGKNHLGKITNFISAFLGLKTKGSRAAFRKSVNAFRASRSGGGPRSGGGAPAPRTTSAPTARR